MILAKELGSKVVDYQHQYQAKDFKCEFKYSLWTDLCGEQTEF